LNQSFFLVFTSHIFLLTIAMASESAPSASDFAELSIGTDDTESQLELPEYDEHSIYHGGKTYKRGNARPAKKKDKSPFAWYWNHGEELSENGRKRWMCKPCWEAKAFTNYANVSNQASQRARTILARPSARLVSVALVSSRLGPTKRDETGRDPDKPPSRLRVTSQPVTSFTTHFAAFT
jgi:hypothetical protein